MWNLVQRYWPTSWWRRKMFAIGVVAGIAVAAFCWGKREAHSQVAGGLGHGQFHPASSDYPNRVVAYIFDNKIPITREDLGEYLIARFGTPDRIEYLVNHKIVDHACKLKNVSVSQQEIDAQLKDDLKNFNVSQDIFVNKILKPRGKTLFEYREDVIRVQLSLAKLCRDQVRVTNEDIHKAFEAKYGEKVDCRWIILPKEVRGKWKETWTNACKSEPHFVEEAKKQGNEMAQNGGKVPPIHKHFPDVNIESAAFRLKEGQVSEIIGLPDGNGLILRCEKRLPADISKRLTDEAVHRALHAEVYELKLKQEVLSCFEHLRKQAKPTILVK